MWNREQLDALLSLTTSVLIFGCLLANQLENNAKQNKLASDRKTLADELETTRQQATIVQQELEVSTNALLGKGTAATRTHIPRQLRLHVLRRCQCTCSYCNRTGTPNADPDNQPWHMEHVVAVNRGGPTRADNLTLACSSCNLRKGTMPAYAFIEKLVKEGVRRQ